jgi:hypothetical protein
MNFNIVKQPPSSRSLVRKLTKKIESLLESNGFAESIQILVTEVQCFEPDCVPIETLIILLGNNSRWTTKILKPLSEVTEDDLNTMAGEIPSSLPVIQTDLMRRKKEKEGEEEEEQEAWVLSITKVIDQKKEEPQSRGGLLFLQKYLERILSSPDTAALTSSSEVTAPSPMSLSTPSPPTVVKMRSTSSLSTLPSSTLSSLAPVPVSAPAPAPTLHTLPRQPPAPPPVILMSQQQRFNDEGPKPRHQKGVRQRGCPCCDPDNLDNIVDRLLYFDTPP